MSKGAEVGEERALPGKKSAELLSVRNEYVPKGVFQVIPVFVAKGKGALVEDVDGNEYIDFAACISVLNAAHCHDEIVSVIN